MYSFLYTTRRKVLPAEIQWKLESNPQSRMHVCMCAAQPKNHTYTDLKAKQHHEKWVRLLSRNYVPCGLSITFGSVRWSSLRVEQECVTQRAVRCALPQGRGRNQYGQIHLSVPLCTGRQKGWAGPFFSFFFSFLKLLRIIQHDQLSVLSEALES